jgi:methionine-rich copper-binding protein CopC
MFMKTKLAAISFALLFAVLAAAPEFARAQKGFEVVTGNDFNRALPKDFYLEGNAIPTEKRNAALLMSPTGHRLVVALVDTAGYTSQVQQKYEGMLINEGPVVVCGKQLGVGSFGFGMKMPSPQSAADAEFILYNQAGKEVSRCAAKKDNKMKHPVPLQVVLQGEKTADLYLGRYEVTIKP